MTNQVDFRELLKKYMKLIRYAEGGTYVDYLHLPEGSHDREEAKLTLEEVKELQSLSDELRLS